MPQELKLITASGDRTARLWDVSSDHTQIQEFGGHVSSVKTIAFRNQDKGLTNFQILPQKTCIVISSLKKIEYFTAVFATGGRDGAVLIWDTRASHNGIPKPDNSITKAHDVIPTGQIPCKSPSRSIKAIKNCSPISVTALAFQDDYTLFSCSAGDGYVELTFVLLYFWQ